MSEDQASELSSQSSSSSTASYGEVLPSFRRSFAVPLSIITEADETASEARSDSRPLRTLEDVRQQTAQSIALRALRKAEQVDDSRVGVIITLSHSADEHFLRLIASALKHALPSRSYVFAVATPSATPGEESPLIFCGSSDDAVQRAGLLISSKFLGRVTRAQFFGRGLWMGTTRDLGTSSFDESALWDVVRKSARKLIDPLIPPPGSRSVFRLVSDARSRLERVTPQQAFAELHDLGSPWPVILVDIRPDSQRRYEGGIHGSALVERSVLEWRFDPRSPNRLPIANRYDLRVILFCQNSDTSSLAAASLHDLGLLNATDIIGGFIAWKEAGLPGEVSPTRVPSSIVPSEEY